MTQRGLFIALLLVAFTLWTTAQESDSASEDSTEDPVDTLFDDPLFDDPFAVSDDEEDEVDDGFFADAFDGPVEDGGGGNSETGPETGTGDVFAIDDLDSLFASDEIIEESTSSPLDAAPATDLLVTEGVRWGGRIRGSVSIDYAWDDVWTSEFGPFDPTSQSLSPSIGASLFFDARPDPEFRAFGKLDLDTTTDGGFDFTGFTFDPATIDESNLPDGWTTQENDDGDTEVVDGSGTVVLTIPTDDEEDGEDDEEESEGSLGTAPGLELSVFELFSDFTWRDELFFRFGKHTIKWGTGYFFSPADVLNLTSVDAEDPTADREGPVSLRVQYPFGITGNLYLYGVFNGGAEPLDAAIAPKVEFAVGQGELAFGGYYQRTLSPRLVVLYTSTIGEIDFFSEVVGLYGSDRVFVRPSRDQSAATEDPEDNLDIVVETFEVPNALFMEATAGARYLKDWEDAGSLAVIVQYYFNGDGYADDVEGLLPAAARLIQNPGENGLAIADPDAQPEGYEDPPALGFGDLTEWGRHYVGATVSYSDIFESDFGVTAFALVNLSDLSGIVTPAVSYRFLDRFSLSASARFTFGEGNDEFTNPAAIFTGDPAEPTFGLTLSVSMPGGAF